MASPSESTTAKRRLGRRRLPPLEPGPALQFVVANHPDQFRAGRTMRHVRSHVMYQHRTERKTIVNDNPNISLRRSASASAFSTPLATNNPSEANSTDFTYLVPPQSTLSSSNWTGNMHGCASYIPVPSTLQTIVQRCMSATDGALARSAPPVFGDASAFPFPDTYIAPRVRLEDVKEQYINDAVSFCDG